jgi:alkylglycerol monooxygenase
VGSKLVILEVLLFLFFLLLEYYISKKRNQEVFKYGSSVSNISIGIAERFINLFVGGLFYACFVYVYENYSLFELSKEWYVCLLLLVVADLVWYWYHRLGHQINLFWAAHIVHHHSDEFNFTAATRITTIQAFIRTPFWSILPLLGFHPDQVMLVLVLHGMYSFFTHTQVIHAPKWLEYVLITPSLHGVHHASNEKYLDKNFGDVFVFWDKLFGTFQQEEEKPIYGITHPLNRYSFLWQHFHYYLEIIEGMKREKTIKRKLKIIFGSPEVMDQNIRPAIEKIFFEERKEKTLGENLKKYVNSQLVFVFLLLTFITFTFTNLDGYEKLNFSGILIVTLINIGALLEQKKWIYYLEIFRLFFLSMLFSHKMDSWLLIFLMLNVLLVLCLSKASKKWYFYYFLEYEKIDV